MISSKPSSIQSSSNNTSKLQQLLEAIWYENAFGKILLSPLEGLYRVAAVTDRYFKQKQQIKHSVPVIVVGNINVGGTGKTPLVIYLIKLLKSHGYKPGIITRGYGSHSSDWPIVVTPDSSAEDCGDEAVLMAQRSSVPVVAGPNRNDDVTHLLANNDIDVIVSDDGLQHHQLHRDIEIVVIDGARGIGNGRCLPAGPLREPVKRLDQCDFVIVNEVEKNAHYSMQQQAMELRSLTLDVIKPFSDCSRKTVHAVTGIGNPDRFFNLLKSFGFDLIEHRFSDHHAFSTFDIHFDDGLLVIMTEKDAVKCRRFAGAEHWYVPINAVVNERFSNDFMARLNSIRVSSKQADA